jgi:hypothetical protein
VGQQTHAATPRGQDLSATRCCAWLTTSAPWFRWRHHPACSSSASAFTNDNDALNRVELARAWQVWHTDASCPGQIVAKCPTSVRRAAQLGSTEVRQEEESRW